MAPLSALTSINMMGLDQRERENEAEHQISGKLIQRDKKRYIPYMVLENDPVCD